MPGEEIAVVYRSLAAAAPLVERVFGSTGSRSRSTGGWRSGTRRSAAALLALARCALLDDGPGRVGDLLEYLRSPASPESPETVDRLESDVRRKSLRTMAAARARLGSELPEIDALHVAEDPAAELAAQARRLLATPYEGRAPVLGTDEELDAHALGGAHPSAERARGIGARRP